MKNIYFLGGNHTSNNGNRGCVALTIGAINLLVSKYNILEYKLIIPKKENSTDEQILKINGKSVKITIEYINSKNYYKAFCDIFKYFFTKETDNNLINEILKSDCIYAINEGDGFTDIYGIKRFFKVFVESAITILLNKPLIILPQTIGPFNTIIGKLLSIFILKFSKKVFTRDNKAEKFFKKIGVKSSIEYDLSVHMKPEVVEHIEIKPNTIGINISGTLYYKTDLADSKPFQNYELFIQKLTQFLLDEGYNVLLVPHVYNFRNEYHEDLDACREIARKINSNKLSIIDSDYTAPQIKYVISKLDFLLSSRMHANLAALSTTTPTIGLAYSYKFEGTFTKFEVPDCVVNIKNICEDDFDKIFEKINKLIMNKDSIKKQLIVTNSKIGIPDI